MFKKNCKTRRNMKNSFTRKRAMAKSSIGSMRLCLGKKAQDVKIINPVIHFTLQK